MAAPQTHGEPCMRRTAGSTVELKHVVSAELWGFEWGFEAGAWAHAVELDAAADAAVLDLAAAADARLPVPSSNDKLKLGTTTVIMRVSYYQQQLREQRPLNHLKGTSTVSQRRTGLLPALPDSKSLAPLAAEDAP
eukprot:scaffold38317_cov58-Phaeocystis_antarctica.AAC.6